MFALIFNPYFILINLFAFFFVVVVVFFTCSKSSIVFILSLGPFVVDLPVLHSPGKTGGLLVFWCFQGRGMGVLGTFGSINDDLIWLMKFPVYAHWGRQRACDSRVFSRDMELERWSEMGRAQETNIYQQ